MFILIINFSPILTLGWFVIQKQISSGGLYSNSHFIQNNLFPIVTFRLYQDWEDLRNFVIDSWDHPHILNYLSDSKVSTVFQVW